MSQSCIYSNDFKVSGELPIGDRLAELPLFPLPGGGVMLDELLAKKGSSRLRREQALGGLEQSRRQAPMRRMLAVVGVALDRRVGLDTILDAPQPGSDRGRQRDVRVDIRGRNAVLDAMARRTAANHAQRSGTVLDPPSSGGGRPVARNEARIAVYRAGHHRQHLRHQRLLAAEEPTHGVRHLMRLRGIVKDALALGGAQRNVQMTALTRNAVGPLRHERRHQAVALRQNFGECLEERRAVGRFEGIAIRERSFENSGPGLGVQSLDRKSHGLSKIEKIVVQVRMHGASQYRVAKGTGRHGLQLPVALVANRLRRFVKNEKFEFRGGADGVPRLRGALQHTPQHPSWTHRFRAARKLAEKKQGFRLEWDVALSRGKNPHRGIRIGGMPAGKFRVVVELIVRIPAQNHVAKSEILLETREELVAAQVFSAHDPVGVENADLYVLNAAFGQQLNDIGVLLQRSGASRI